MLPVAYSSSCLQVRKIQQNGRTFPSKNPPPREGKAKGNVSFTRYAPDSVTLPSASSSCLQVRTRERCNGSRVETYLFKNSSPGGDGESKRKRKFDEKDTVVGLGFSPQN
jgi:hypothetical protein